MLSLILLRMGFGNWFQITESVLSIYRIVNITKSVDMLDIASPYDKYWHHFICSGHMQTSALN